MKFKYKLFLSLSCLTLTLSCYSQKDKTIVSVDRNNEPRNYTYPFRQLVENTSVLKFSPLQLAMGEINFGWERKIDKIKSVDFEFGPTLSKIGFTVNNNKYQFYNDTFPYRNESSKLGFFGAVGLRFYPLEKGLVLNNFYVSPVLKYRVKNIGYSDVSSKLPDRKGTEIDFNFSFNFGYQKWFTQNFCLDFFGGIGLSQESHREFEIINATSTNPEWRTISYSGVRFLLTAGVKVGIGH